MFKPPARRRRWWTRPETLMIAGLLTGLGSALFSAGWAWQRHARLLMAEADLRALGVAVQRYHRDYGSWPGAQRSQANDLRFGGDVSNREVMNILQALEGPGNAQHAGNDQQIVFIEIEPYTAGASGLDTDGAFLDPWGTEYQMVFDANFDNVCEVDNSIYGRLIGQGYALWSCGPDRMSDTPDDLLSWTAF